MRRGKPGIPQDLIGAKWTDRQVDRSMGCAFGGLGTGPLPDPDWRSDSVTRGRRRCTADLGKRVLTSTRTVLPRSNDTVPNATLTAMGAARPAQALSCRCRNLRQRPSGTAQVAVLYPIFNGGRTCSTLSAEILPDAKTFFFAILTAWRERIRKPPPVGIMLKRAASMC